MTALLILAFNEEKYIEELIDKYIQEFEEIIVIDDASIDSTSEILKKLSSKKLKVITNKKNYGAGRSFEIGLEAFLETENRYLIKIDGDDQFTKKDILYLKDLSTKDTFDFVTCDRFWARGIIGEIPTIRYFGNAFASLLVKLSTGNWRMNDPLNGLFLINRKAAKEIKLPKKFFRYGYPFFINVKLINSVDNIFKIGQFQNSIKYLENKKSINPFKMFIKLLMFSIVTYLKKIKFKIRISELQSSAIFDTFSIFSFILATISFSKIFIIRYFDQNGSQTTWFVIFLLLLFLFALTFFLSQKIETEFKSKNFSNIKN